MAAIRVPLDELAGWWRDQVTGNIAHESGKFFTIEGLDVRHPGGPVPSWTQPIINQPEVGVLGILLKRVDGVPYLLMQAKNEPGNINGAQLSPTVQATRSNYTRVHGGRAVPYLEYFRSPSGRVLADVRQSEQGAWFYRKRNRNMLVEVAGVEVLDGFRWFSLPDVLRMLSVPDLVNMDARTVLSCLPRELWGPGPAAGSSDGQVLSWITRLRSTVEVNAERIPLGHVRDWELRDGRISHRDGRFFDVIGLKVSAVGREVLSWSQPMIEPVGTGISAFLIRWVDGVLKVLVQARVEPGYHDVIELGPTVQCTPANHDSPPPFLAEVTAADARVRFDTVLSEEGGRFHHARTRYIIAETDAEVDHPFYRWVTLGELGELLRHSHYLNVQARTLTACLFGLVGELAAA